MTRILIVDDDKEIADLIEIYLRNEGYQLFKAHDGVEALSVLERDPVDLVILDIMMPKLDGMSVCLKIREKQATPVLMLSAKAEDMDKIMGLMTGADDYMVKPFNPLGGGPRQVAPSPHVSVERSYPGRFRACRSHPHSGS